VPTPRCRWYRVSNETILRRFHEQAYTQSRVTLGRPGDGAFCGLATGNSSQGEESLSDLPESTALRRLAFLHISNADRVAKYSETRNWRRILTYSKLYPKANVGHHALFARKWLSC
jgi:hypothetical protein